jgi:flagellar protein FlaG
MIDSISGNVNADNLVRNTGEGSVPSPPPSPETIKRTASGQGQAAVEVDVQIGLKGEEAGDLNRNTGQATPAEQAKTDKELDEELTKVVEELNKKLNRLDREVLFKVDKKINKNYISVIDKGSKEVIREFPPEEIRTFIARFDEINQKLNVSSDVKSLIINLEV